MKRDLENITSLAASMYASIIGSLMFMFIPLFIGALSDHFSYSSKQVGFLGSADMIGMLIGSILVSFIIRKVNWSKLATLATGLYIFSHVLSFVIQEYFYIFFFVRVLSGIAGVTLMSVAFSHISDTRNPDRNFAIFITAQLIIGALGTYILSIMMVDYGVNAMFTVLTVFSISVLFFVRLIPEHGIGKEEQVSKQKGISFLGWYSILTLVGVFFFGLGVMLVWSYVERIGVNQGMSTEEAGRAISIALAASVSGPIFAALLGQRFGRKLPIVLSFIFLALTSYFISYFNDFVFFSANLIVFAIFWNFVSPYMLAIISKGDISGRAIVLALAVTKGGYALAPILGGLLLSWGGHTQITMAGIVCFALAYIFLYAPIKKFNK